MRCGTVVEKDESEGRTVERYSGRTESKKASRRDTREDGQLASSSTELHRQRQTEMKRELPTQCVRRVMLGTDVVCVADVMSLLVLSNDAACSNRALTPPRLLLYNTASTPAACTQQRSKR